MADFAVSSEALGPGVYLLLFQGKVVYVGMSGRSMLARVGTHATEGKEFDQAVLRGMPGASVETLKLEESRLILAHAPRYNYGNGKKTKGRLLLSSRHLGPNAHTHAPPQ